MALAGVDGLRALVTDWDFDEAGFADYVGPALELLARLLQGSAEFDTQLQARCPLSMRVHGVGQQRSRKCLLHGVFARANSNTGRLASAAPCDAVACVIPQIGLNASKNDPSQLLILFIE